MIMAIHRTKLASLQQVKANRVEGIQNFWTFWRKEILAPKTVVYSGTTMCMHWGI